LRLWSIHPKYLDSKGLVAVWREGLLALEVLKGKTKGYRNHSQLIRFKTEMNPIETIKNYLWFIYIESVKRGYHFDPARISNKKKCRFLTVTSGQLEYEFNHLKQKLLTRNQLKYKAMGKIDRPLPHPLFKVVPGKVEGWEIIKQK
jgi:hypothetical protein